MRMPRFRVRTLMIATAIVAILIAARRTGEYTLKARREGIDEAEYRRVADSARTSIEGYRKGAWVTGPGALADALIAAADAEEVVFRQYLDLAAWKRSRRARYARAATYFWEAHPAELPFTPGLAGPKAVMAASPNGAEEDVASEDRRSRANLLGIEDEGREIGSRRHGQMGCPASMMRRWGVPCPPIRLAGRRET